MGIGEHEWVKFGLTVLTEIQGRAVQDILVVVVDNLTELSEAIASVFPRSDVQKCIIYRIRNSVKYVDFHPRQGHRLLGVRFFL